MGRGHKMTADHCPFCAPDLARVFFESDGVVALWDAFSVTGRHAFIIPKRHVVSWFDATAEEQAEFLRTIPNVRKEIEALHSPDGYNIGINVGMAAGRPWPFPPGSWRISSSGSIGDRRHPFRKSRGVPQVAVSGLIFSISSTSSDLNASHRSTACCMFSQDSASVLVRRARRKAVSGVTRRLPLTISFNRG